MQTESMVNLKGSGRSAPRLSADVSVHAGSMGSMDPLVCTLVWPTACLEALFRLCAAMFMPVLRARTLRDRMVISEPMG